MTDLIHWVLHTKLLFLEVSENIIKDELLGSGLQAQRVYNLWEKPDA